MKRRSVLDVVCGAVIGAHTAPHELVIGLPIDGALRIVGRTGPLSPGDRSALRPWLVPPLGEHPWPSQVSPSSITRFRTSRDLVDLTLVEPIAVEVSADAAWDGRSFRHILRFLRVRPDTEVSSVRRPPVTSWSAQ